MSRIDAPEDSHPLEKGRKGSRKDVNMKLINEGVDEDERVLEIADPVKQVRYTISLWFSRVVLICKFVLRTVRNYNVKMRCLQCVFGFLLYHCLVCQSLKFLLEAYLCVLVMAPRH